MWRATHRFTFRDVWRWRCLQVLLTGVRASRAGSGSRPAAADHNNGDVVLLRRRVRETVDGLEDVVDESGYPIVQGYKSTQALGVRLNFSDPLQLNRLSLVGSYSPWDTLEASERVHLKAEYQRYDWKLKAQLNNADFYDVFGPTKTGRKGYLVGLGYRRSLIYDEPVTLGLELSARRHVGADEARGGRSDLPLTPVRGRAGLLLPRLRSLPTTPRSRFRSPRTARCSPRHRPRAWR